MTELNATQTVHFATVYNSVREARRHEHATVFKDESLTSQSDLADADINVIVGRFIKSGLLPNVNLEPLYGDFTEVGDFADAQRRILEGPRGIPHNPRSNTREIRQQSASLHGFCPKSGQYRRITGDGPCGKTTAVGK